MKALRTFFGLAIVTLALTLSGSKAQAQDNHYVRLINHTNSPVRFFYAAPAGNSNTPWGYDLLGSGVMVYVDYSMIVNVHPEQDRCHFDLKAILLDGREVTRGNADICTMESWTLSE